MAVGEIVTTKFIWLLDEVEIVGVVHNIEGDSFDVEPDFNYRHVISYMRGNNPLPWLSVTTPGLLHCETYVIDPSRINRTDPWRLPTKPDQPFKVKLQQGGTRDLVEGDHVRVVGRWVIDHHPEFCSKPETLDPPEPTRCRDRGWLRVGQCHAEFHPFAWDDISLAEELPPTGTRSLTLSLAAPIHEEQYLGGWKWFANEIAGVAGKVFIADDLSNYHETVSAAVTISAPSIPVSWSEVWRKLVFKETVLRIGTGLTVDQVRAITPRTDGIDVNATVSARRRPGRRASIYDPANNQSIFQARYDVSWTLVGARISCVNKPIREDPDQPIHSVGGLLPDGTRWRLTLAEAIRLLKRGHSFYVEEPAGDRVAVEIARSRWDNEYLKTVADYEEPNNLLALPECPR